MAAVRTGYVGGCIIPSYVLVLPHLSSPTNYSTPGSWQWGEEQCLGDSLVAVLLVSGGRVESTTPRTFYIKGKDVSFPHYILAGYAGRVP